MTRTIAFRLRTVAAVMVASAQLLGESKGVSIPAGADPAPYKQLGVSMSGKAWAKRVSGTSFDYVSAIDLGRGWFATAAHTVVGNGWTATITEVGNGVNPTTNPGPRHAVTEQHMFPLYVPPYLNGGNNTTVDLLLFYSPTAPKSSFAIIGEKPQASGKVTCGGYGYLATQVGYENPIYVVPYDQDVAGWNGSYSTTVAPNFSSSLHFSADYLMGATLSEKGVGSFLNSGSRSNNSRGDLIGMVVGGNSLSTVILDFTNPEVIAFIRQYVPVLKRSEIVPSISCSPLTANIVRVEWNTSDAIGFRLQFTPELNPADWQFVTPAITTEASYDHPKTTPTGFFRLVR